MLFVPTLLTPNQEGFSRILLRGNKFKKETMKLTKSQKAWCKKYQDKTGFEVIDCGKDFKDRAKINVKWWIDYADEVTINIEDYPGRFDDILKEK